MVWDWQLSTRPPRVAAFVEALLVLPCLRRPRHHRRLDPHLQVVQGWSCTRMQEGLQTRKNHPKKSHPRTTRYGSEDSEFDVTW